MIRCETCIYKKNCQFLATHKKAVVVDCETYESETKLKNEISKEIFEELDAYLKTWRTKNQNKIKYHQPEYYKGKIVAADEVAWFIRTELKKKFMEEENEQ